MVEKCITFTYICRNKITLLGLSVLESRIVINPHSKSTYVCETTLNEKNMNTKDVYIDINVFLKRRAKFYDSQHCIRDVTSNEGPFIAVCPKGEQ